MIEPWVGRVGADQGEEAGRVQLHLGTIEKHISLIINDIIPVICNPTF